MKAFYKYVRLTVCLALCVGVFALCAAPAFAVEPEGVVDDAALQAMVDSFVQERGLDPKNFSIGYVYTGTGEEWYYNPDTWYYPASVYKVPLMMQLAEKVHSGELSQDSDLGGYTVATAEEYIISYSNNDYAHLVRKYLGGDEVWRQAAKGYTKLEDSYYHSDYMDYCYFSPRYITQVLTTLYNESERFPNILECMMAAEQSHYFRLSDSMKAYTVAQKYGSYCDHYGDNFNHTVGVVYTPTPFILTVMTLNAQGYEKVISDAAVMFTEYTLSLEEELVVYEQEQAEAAAEKAEAEKKAAAEQAATEKAAAEKAEAEKIAAEKAEAEAEQRQQRKSGLIKLGIVAAAVLFVLILLVVLLRKRAKRKRYEEYRRRFEYELENDRRYRR